ncbi:MAG: hypothetical protein K2Q01_11545 [Rickettsiales bacterium]|nr:hypothetical protein [Rickettsiales bacterium]
MTDTAEVEPKENLKPLKMLVFSMGLIMIGGTVLLAMMVWKKVDSEASGTAPAYGCAGGEIDMAGRGQVLNLEREGKQLYVTFQKDARTLEVATLDLCSGKLKSSVMMAIDGRKH